MKSYELLTGTKISDLERCNGLYSALFHQIVWLPGHIA